MHWLQRKQSWLFSMFYFKQQPCLPWSASVEHYRYLDTTGIHGKCYERAECCSCKFLEFSKMKSLNIRFVVVYALNLQYCAFLVQPCIMFAFILQLTLFCHIYYFVVTLLLTKGTQGFIHCSFKAASLATVNKQMLSCFSNTWCFVIGYHKAQLHLVWLHHCWYMCHHRK